MNRILRNTFAAACLGAALTVKSFAAEEGGFVDFGKFTAASGREFVEVNLPSSLLKFAARIAATDEPEVAQLLRSITQVRVNVIGMDETNRESTVSRIEGIRADLEKRGWQKIVTARAGADGGSDDVAVYLKSRGEDAIEGVVVTVIARKGEAVLVNIVGNIRADQIAELAEQLDIKPLRKLRIERGKAEAAT